MGSKKLTIAAVVLLGLSGVLWYSNKHPEWGVSKKTDPDSNQVAVTIPDADVQSVEIRKKDGSQATIERKAGKWSITAPAAFTADQETANSLLTALSTINADSVVEENPADVSKYGLTNPSLLVIVHEKNAKTRRLTFGDDLPADSNVYFRVEGNPKVFAVNSSLKSSLDKSVNDLRDKRLLTYDGAQLSRIQVSSGKSNVEFGKNAQGDWAIVAPDPFRADSFQIEELLRKLADSKMDLSAAADDAKKAESGFAKGAAVAEVKLTDNTGAQTLEVRKSGDDYFGKSSAVAGIYKLSADLGKQLEKPAEDYRNKKLFDFGFTDPSKLEIQTGAGTRTLTRSGADWSMNGKVMDSAGVQSLIDKLRDLSAAQFVFSGFIAADATITIVSNEGKRTEKVEFSKTPTGGFVARRGAEPGLYALDGKTVSDILDESAKLKPAPPKK